VAPAAIVSAVLGAEFDESARLLPTFALAWVAGCGALIASQALVAAGRLRFLPLYLAGVGVEAWLLLAFDADALALARVTLWVKVVLFVVLVALVAWVRPPRPLPSSASERALDPA
jgi:hypothetical protein